MIDYLKIEDAPDLIKDTKSGAILNTNVKGLEAYRKQREKAKQLNNMDSRVSKIESDLTQIKTLLLQLLEEKKHGS